MTQPFARDCGYATHGKVALVCMPFQQLNATPLAPALLKSLLQARGICCDVHYLNFWFAEAGPESYDLIAGGAYFLGEWLFSHALALDWDRDPGTSFDRLMKIVSRAEPRARPLDAPRRPSARPRGASLYREPKNRQRILNLQERVLPFLDRCLETVDWSQYDLVGFTSTFQQQTASLALARRLKDAWPHLVIVFGGANCDGDMGRSLFDNFLFVDAVWNGEADSTFPVFVNELMGGAPPRPLPGVLDRRLPNPTEETGRPMTTDLDALPYPDHSDFFAQLDSSELAQDGNILVYFESSRGCWWGEKNQCRFCGVNGATIGFRQKTPQRTLDEIKWLCQRHRGQAKVFGATDNIMPADFVRTVLPDLKELGPDTEFFWETKANLKKEQIRMFSEVGLRHTQPGIESLSTPILKLMHKGITALQNIEHLKWSRQFGVFPGWNYLYCFPGELVGFYEGQARLMGHLHHLEPPHVCSPIRFDRYSPYLLRSDEFGLRDIRPHPVFEELYPLLPDTALAGLATSFYADYDARTRSSEYESELINATDSWRHDAPTAALFSIEGAGGLVVGDFRSGRDKLTTFAGANASLLGACDSVVGRRSLLRLLELSLGSGEGSEQRLDDLLGPLLEEGLLVAENERYLSLVIPLDEALLLEAGYFPPANCWGHFERMLAMLA